MEMPGCPPDSRLQGKKKKCQDRVNRLNSLDHAGMIEYDGLALNVAKNKKNKEHRLRPAGVSNATFWTATRSHCPELPEGPHRLRPAGVSNASMQCIRQRVHAM